MNSNRGPEKDIWNLSNDNFYDPKGPLHLYLVSITRGPKIDAKWRQIHSISTCHTVKCQTEIGWTGRYNTGRAHFWSRKTSKRVQYHVFEIITCQVVPSGSFGPVRTIWKIAKSENHLVLNSFKHFSGSKMGPARVITSCSPNFGHSFSVKM